MYGNLGEFDLKLNLVDARVNNPPPSQLRVYEEAFEVGLRFPVPSFVLELLIFYGIFLYILTPNFLRLVLRFLVICFVAKVWPCLTFHSVPFILPRGILITRTDGTFPSRGG